LDCNIRIILPLCFRTLIHNYTNTLSVYTYAYFTLHIYVTIMSLYSVGVGRYTKPIVQSSLQLREICTSKK